MIEAARRADPADVERIVELAAVLYDEMRGLRGGDVWAARDARLRDPDVYNALIADDGGIVVVGTIDDYVVGYATADVEILRDGRRLGVVRELYVEPPARAVGVGEAMINLVLDGLRDAGCAGVDAYALPGHRDAKNFFEEQGLTARLLVMHREL